MARRGVNLKANMNKKLKEKIISFARKYNKNDPSHDFEHALRVLHLSEKIAEKEEKGKADLDILIPAALFHDVIVYRKDISRSKREEDESAELAGKELKKLKEYPEDKISKVQTCIRQCSFSKGITPKLFEAKILQDADRLKATGAVSIMRTFSSCGQMNRRFYDPQDPFRKNGLSPGSYFGLDLFYDRLLVVGGKMHTQYARKLAKRRTEFLRSFLKELKNELKESGRI